MQENDWTSWGIPLIIVLVLLLVILLGLFALSKWIRGPMYKGHARIDGKVVVITGCNTGLGKETARDLSRRGGRIIMACRNLDKAKAAADGIQQDTGGKVEYYELDLSSLESVRACAESIKEKEPNIDILINNAGIMACPQWETKDGFEMQFGTNHLGHFLFTTLLLDNIKAASPSRIINLSSLAHTGGEMYWADLNRRKNYTPHGAYSQSKLANILFTRALAKRLENDGVTCYAVHPGAVNTELSRNLEEAYGSCVGCCLKCFPIQYFTKTPILGAQTSIYCAVDEKAGEETAKYYSDCQETKPTRQAESDVDAERLWNASMEMVHGTTLQAEDV